MDGIIEITELLAQIKPCECEVDGKCNFHPSCCFCEMFIRQEKAERKKMAEQNSLINQ